MKHPSVKSSRNGGVDLGNRLSLRVDKHSFMSLAFASSSVSGHQDIVAFTFITNAASEIHNRHFLACLT